MVKSVLASPSSALASVSFNLNATLKLFQRINYQLNDAAALVSLSQSSQFLVVSTSPSLFLES